MKRRTFLGTAAAAVATARLGIPQAQAAAVARVRPGRPGWPGEADWASLNEAVGGRLSPVTLPNLSPEEAKTLLANPLYIREQAGLTQSSGYVDAWRSAPSVYAVRAKGPADVSAAVRFAAAHRLRLVVKGGGHSYVGGSNAPDSLLLWTRDMDAIELHDAFVPQGSAAAPQQAVSLGAGCIWLHVYQAVTGKAGRYVQGGGCTTVGVAGFIQGGGFGSFSKGFGLGAASLLEAEIVTADGQVRIVNEAQEPDLFWALKGGGGGTFGVVTRLTLKTHALPERVGAVFWQVEALSDDALRALIDAFLAHYSKALFNPHWGEQARVTRSNRLNITMLFQGLDQDTARAAWSELEAFVLARAADYKVIQPLTVLALPARHFWDSAYLSQNAPGVAVPDTRPEARPGDYYWATNVEEAGAFWHGYASAWLPATLLQDEARAGFVEALFQASRLRSVGLHMNKGLAGAADMTLEAARDTATNPQVTEAFALAIIASNGPTAFAPFPAPDLARAREDNAAIRSAMSTLRQLAPDAGCYISECDYGVENWQAAFWGPNAARLGEVKKRYDPESLFIVHHGVGSEGWSRDGFDPV